MLKRDYYQSKYNLSSPNKRREEIEKEKKSFKKVILFFVLLIIVIGIIYGLFFSPIFQIQKIIVTGTNKAEEMAQIEKTTREFMLRHRFYFLTQKNLFILNKTALKDQFNKNFDLEQIEIKTKLPTILKIELREQAPALIWQEGNEYFILDQNGLLKNKIDNIQMFELPIVNAGTTTEMVLGKKYLTNEQINFIKKIFSLFNFYFNDLGIKQFVVTTLESREVKLITSENWHILFNLDLDPQESLVTVKAVLEQKIGERSHLKYIDARIKDRVYYKE